MEKFNDGEDIIVTGTISKIEKKEEYILFFIKDTSINGSKRHITFIVSANNESKNEQIKHGNIIKAHGKYKEFKRARNYGNFDEYDYYRSLGISGKIYAERVEVISFKIFPLRNILFNLKEKMMEGFKNISDSKQLGIMNAIVTGDRTLIDEEDIELYKQSGIAHMLAISGLHISMIGAFIYNFLKKISKIKTATVISSVIMILYFIMTGGQISAFRATFMFLCYLLSAVTGRRYDLLSALSISSFIVMFLDTCVITNSGFLLSYFAVLSMSISGKVIEYLEINNNAIKAFITCLFINLITHPVIAEIYFQIPLYSVFLNLIVIPIMSLILSSAMLSALFAFFFKSVSRFAAGSGIYLLTFIEIAGYVSIRLPNAIITTGHIPAYTIVIYYFFLLLLCAAVIIYKKQKRKNNLFLNKKISYFLRISITCVVIIICICLICTPERNKNLKIDFFDVDQGDGIMIQNEDRGIYFIDGGSTGTEDVYKYRISKSIKYEGIRRIDYWIITHPDKDHISGLIELLKNDEADSVDVGCILTPEITDNILYDELKYLAYKRNIKFQNIYSGSVIKDGELYFECIYPNKGSNILNANDNSCVMKLEYNGFKALFTGDIGEEIEDVLINENRLCDIDLLKVAHHGSKNSSSDEFLKITKPEIAIISAGVNNIYGHPHNETLNRLSNAGCGIFGTYKSGCISVEIDEENIKINEKINERGRLVW